MAYVVGCEYRLFRMAVIVAAIVSGIVSLLVAVVAGFINRSNNAALQDQVNYNQWSLAQLQLQMTYGQSISRTQWDVELSILREVWSTTQEATFCYEDIVDLTEEGDPKGKFSLSVDKLEEANTTASNAFQKNAPFYPETIRSEAYYLVKRLIGLHTSIKAMKVDDWKAGDWQAERKKEIVELYALQTKLDNAIRQRLSSVIIVK